MALGQTSCKINKFCGCTKDKDEIFWSCAIPKSSQKGFFMKLILLTLVLFSLNSFAADETCFVIAPRQAKNLPANMPQKICLESLSIDAVSEKISVATKQPELFKGLITSYFARKNEDSFRFHSYGTFHFNEEPSCGQSETLELYVSGIVNNYGESLNSDMKISIDRYLIPNTCNVSGQRTTYWYQIAQ